jgi:transcription initiation factor TFIID subunit 7
LFFLLQGEYATRLRDLVESGDEKIRDRLFIDINPETRRGRIKFDDTIFKGTLYDLPCITESYKTFDRKTLYKIADVAQVRRQFCFFFKFKMII